MALVDLSLVEEAATEDEKEEDVFTDGEEEEEEDRMVSGKLAFNKTILVLTDYQEAETSLIIE